MSQRFHNSVLAVLIGAIWFATSNVVTLCVHAEQVGFEPSWATCCETASCCETAAASDCETDHVHVRGADGCRDYTLAMGDDWTPDDPRPVVHPSLAFVSAAPAVGALLPATLASAPRLPLGVPPPARPQRCLILRC